MSTSNTERRNLLREELSQASQRIGNLTVLFTNALSSVLGLSATEFEALSLLREGPISAGRLAELCGLTTGAVTGLVDRLEKVGYAERTPDVQDRRRVMVSIKNQDQLDRRAGELYQPVKVAFNELTTKYSLEELAVVLDYMQGANQMMEQLITEFYHRPDEEP